MISNELKYEHKLYKSVDDKKLAGVCGGFAEYFGISALFVRTLTVLLVFTLGPVAIVVYAAFAFALNKRPMRVHLSESDLSISREVKFSPKVTLASLKYKFAKLEARMRKIENYVTSKTFELESEYRKL